MEKEYYINIQWWMVQRLKLKGNELLTYAIVYGFSQDGESQFLGSSKYISYALGVSRPTAIKALDGLTEKGLIIKTQEKINDVVFNRYKVSLQAIKNLDGGYKESLHSNNHKELNIKNNEKKVSKNRQSYNEQIEAYTGDEDLRQALKAFIQMRNMIKKPLTDYALSLILKKLDKLSNDDLTKTAIINQSVEHSWQGVFPLKADYKSNKPDAKPDIPDEPLGQNYMRDDGTFDRAGYDAAVKRYNDWMDKNWTR